MYQNRASVSTVLPQGAPEGDEWLTRAAQRHFGQMSVRVYPMIAEPPAKHIDREEKDYLYWGTEPMSTICGEKCDVLETLAPHAHLPRTRHGAGGAGESHFW